MTNTSFANYQLRSHIRKSQIEMYKEKKDEEHFCQEATLGKYNGFSYKEYESQVCTVKKCDDTRERSLIFLSEKNRGRL